MTIIKSTQCIRFCAIKSLHDNSGNLDLILTHIFEFLKTKFVLPYKYQKACDFGSL